MINNYFVSGRATKPVVMSSGSVWISYFSLKSCPVGLVSNCHGLGGHHFICEGALCHLHTRRHRTWVWSLGVGLSVKRMRPFSGNLSWVLARLTKPSGALRGCLEFWKIEHPRRIRRNLKNQCRAFWGGPNIETQVNNTLDGIGNGLGQLANLSRARIGCPASASVSALVAACSCACWLLRVTWPTETQPDFNQLIHVAVGQWQRWVNGAVPLSLPMNNA